MAAINKNKLKPSPPNLLSPQSIVTIIITPVLAQSNVQARAVSTKDKIFMIHKDYICYYSTFFEKAFNGNFMEGQTQSITLDDVDQEVFGFLVNWLYYQNIEAPIVLDGDTKRAEYEKLVKLWILGDRFRMPALQNATIDMVHFCFTNKSNITANFPDAVKLAMNHDKESLLAKALARGLAWSQNASFDWCMTRISLPMAILVMQELRVKDEAQLNKIHTKKLGSSTEFHVKVPEQK